MQVEAAFAEEEGCAGHAAAGKLVPAIPGPPRADTPNHGDLWLGRLHPVWHESPAELTMGPFNELILSLFLIRAMMLSGRFDT